MFIDDKNVGGVENRNLILNMIKNKKLIGIIGFFLIVSGLFVSRANAGFFEDIWKGLTSPFSKNEPATSSDSIISSPENIKAEDVPLYKPVVDYENAVVSAVKKASPAVVAITISKNVPKIESCPRQSPFGNLPPEFQQFFGGGLNFSVPCENGTELKEVGGGSGFIISTNGLIVTNKHVASDKNAQYTVFTNDGEKYSATILAQDPSQDLAILKIKASGLPTVILGNSSSIELGQTAIAIGNALAEFRNTVSVGVISGLARNIVAGDMLSSENLDGVIQTDAAINPGNSGGPLLNLRGEVIGINTAVANNAQNIGFAIPINRAKRAINSVKTSGEIQTAYLGVRNITVTEEVAKKQNLPVSYGALIRGGEDGPGVQPDSPADKAGIQAEDIILEVNGRRIGKDNPLTSAISEYEVGETVTLKISRAGKEFEVRVVLGKRPTQ